MSDMEQQRDHNPRAPLLNPHRQSSQKVNPDTRYGRLNELTPRHERLRSYVRWFLSSKYGHYAVMILVILDVAGIFADFLISLHICEHRNEDMKTWTAISIALGVLSLVFSCLFMVELLCSIYVFRLSYFRSKFHCFDATAIVASFLIDVLTHGPVEEAGSLVIILRLFRVFKIVEESSTVTVEDMEAYEEKIEGLERENENLRHRMLTIPHALLSEQHRDE